MTPKPGRAPGYHRPMVTLWRAGWALGLLVWLKIASMLLVASIGAATWAGAEYPVAADWARWGLIINVIEPHRAHFNLGTARAAAGDIPGARTELEAALTLTTSADECVVRMNLALVLEKASQATDSETATEDGERARSVIADASESCRASQLRPVADRLQTQAQPPAGDEPSPPAGEDPAGSAPAPADPAPGELGELAKVMESAWAEMNETETESPNHPQGGGIDRPW